MTEYFLCLNLLMLTRLVYLRQDEAIGLRSNLWLSAMQLLLVALCFSFNAALAQLALLIAVVGALNLLFEPRWLKQGWRIFTMLLLITATDLIHGGSTALQLRPALSTAASGVSAASALLRMLPVLPGANLMAVLAGLLLLTNEVNLFIRTVFRHFGLEPARETPPPAGDASTHGIDRKEYNTGRVIGILERWLMYFVMLSTNNLASIALIIAAKGLARMKQLEEKEFAEYMLIGTLLSVLSAVLVGKGVLLVLSV